LTRFFSYSYSEDHDLVKAQGRAIVFAAIGGLFALMGGMVYYASLDVPALESAEIELVNVNLEDVNSIENRIKLEIVFLVKNPSEKTFTVPLITYDLFADGKFLGRGAYSTEDIAMPGRAAFYPGSEIQLKNFFRLELSEENKEQYNSIIRGENINYGAEGMFIIENAWSLVEKEFQSSM